MEASKSDFLKHISIEIDAVDTVVVEEDVDEVACGRFIGKYYDWARFFKVRFDDGEELDGAVGFVDAEEALRDVREKAMEVRRDNADDYFGVDHVLEHLSCVSGHCGRGEN